MGVSRDDWYSVAGSLFLFRKALPVSPRPNFEHRSRVLKPFEDKVPEYHRHLVSLVDELFPIGWDKGYERAVGRAVPGVSSCLENSRSKGGVRGEWLGRREEFKDACLGKSSFFFPRQVRYANVNTGGKSRGVTVSSGDTFILSPLHKLMYDHLSRFDWLLRGEAKPGRFRKFRRVKGEVFVSGDYSSATDNLKTEYAEVLLGRILSRSTYLPGSVRTAAMQSLRSQLYYDDIEGPLEQLCGQLMGNFLSFPLLCLQNYAAFRWCFSKQVPVRINGDDIVFRTTREGFVKWASFCPDVGLEVHPTKTLCDPTYFSLNSAFFKASSAGVSRVPVLRTGVFFKDLDSPAALAGRCRSFSEGFRGEPLVIAQECFLRRYSGQIRASGRSLVRLGVRCDPSAIAAAGLWRRELWYSEAFLSQSAEESPLPLCLGKVRWADVPEGWVRRPAPRSAAQRRRARKSQDDFFEILNQVSWTTPFDVRAATQEHWKECRGSGLESKWDSWRLRSKGKVRGWATGRFFTRGVYASLYVKIGSFVRLPFRWESARNANWRYLRVGEGLRRWLFEPPRRERKIWVPAQGELKPLVFRSGGLMAG